VEAAVDAVASAAVEAAAVVTVAGMEEAVEEIENPAGNGNEPLKGYKVSIAMFTSIDWGNYLGLTSL
jgi:hypothetical protein